MAIVGECREWDKETNLIGESHSLIGTKVYIYGANDRVSSDFRPSAIFDQCYPLACGTKVFLLFGSLIGSADAADQAIRISLAAEIHWRQ